MVTEPVHLQRGGTKFWREEDDFDMNDREGVMFERSPTKKKKTIRFALDDEILGESLPPQ